MIEQNVGHFNLVAKAVEECFKPTEQFRTESDIKFYSKQQKAFARRKNFAHSNILKLWCDCTENFEYEKLKRLILEKNV